MPDLQVGDTAIPYVVRYSERASRKRIAVTPSGVEVVAPEGTPMDGPGGVLAYVEGKRRWVFDSVREIDAKHRKLLTQQYGSGAKLQYRGRWLMLDVRSAEVEAVAIRCRSKFEVEVPSGLEGVERLEAVHVAFDGWLRDRALRDLRRFASKHQRTLGVEAAGVRLGEQKRSWGTCGKDGVIRVHWRLVQAPAAAMEYVTAHEVAHLLHRNHSDEFWATLARTMPEWAERKAMLERWEVEHRAV
jgi:predicted metal-dependent hydrolase